MNRDEMIKDGYRKEIVGEYNDHHGNMPRYMYPAVYTAKNRLDVHDERLYIEVYNDFIRSIKEGDR